MEIIIIIYFVGFILSTFRNRNRDIEATLSFSGFMESVFWFIPYCSIIEPFIIDPLFERLKTKN